MGHNHHILDLLCTDDDLLIQYNKHPPSEAFKSPLPSHHYESMITLAFNDRVIIPLWKKWNGQPGFTHLQRMAIGLVLSTVGMGAAALCERKRLAVAKANGGSNPLHISVFFLLPQFILVGSANAFVYNGQLNFFITESPKGMKTMSTGLFVSSLSFGFFFSSLLVSIVNKVTGGKDGWLASSINNGRLDTYFCC
ncbi:protein NRT1/ PTR FAMILY 6.2-like [Prunus avium]|uniref:Protein NRT1/ PTR FAMILY 6.2-like n=1 Tax=Prunus avium TaxID=42229 RepID=A0A6P5SU84_PRUAV|nr:protein NRT1/ PTR FAMILY 6.2-like [Prunus avium]